MGCPREAYEQKLLLMLRRFATGALHREMEEQALTAASPRSQREAFASSLEEQILEALHTARRLLYERIRAAIDVMPSLKLRRLDGVCDEADKYL